jgi:DHA1 family tetracycline resistance protein-like MFS transporter
MGFVLGPAVGGILGSVNPRLPFLVAGGLSVINGMYGLFVLPESLKPDIAAASRGSARTRWVRWGC